MNCRKLAKIMPELAAGELDSWLADDAMKHLAECEACSTEYKKHRTDAEALSGPWEHLPVPDELALLQLPDYARQPRRWLVPVLASAVILLVVVCCATLLMGPAQDKHRGGINQTAIKQSTPKVKVTDVPDNQQTALQTRRVNVPGTPRPRAVAKHSRRAPVPSVRRNLQPGNQASVTEPLKPKPEQDAQVALPDDTQVVRTPAPPRVGPGQFVVGESSMEITRVDPSTGAVTIYREKRRISGVADDAQLIQYEPEISRNQKEL